MQGHYLVHPEGHPTNVFGFVNAGRAESASPGWQRWLSLGFGGFKRAVRAAGGIVRSERVSIRTPEFGGIRRS